MKWQAKVVGGDGARARMRAQTQERLHIIEFAEDEGSWCAYNDEDDEVYILTHGGGITMRWDMVKELRESIDTLELIRSRRRNGKH